MTQIIFLNMLIAVMADTFTKVKEVEKQAALKETILLMSDYATAVRMDVSETFQGSRFIFAVRPKHQELGEDWEGQVT